MRWDMILSRITVNLAATIFRQSEVGRRGASGGIEMRMWLAFIGIIAAACASASPALANDQAHRKTADEIAEGINTYRASVGLPPVARSQALDSVAQAHVADLVANRPDRGTDIRGEPCNSHSWSEHGPWRPVCYTADHAYAAHMWSKPSELTNGAYRGIGVEIATHLPVGVSAKEAIAGWRSSPAHQTVIIERGVWANSHWQAMGVAARGDYAVVWFGKQPDTTRLGMRLRPDHQNTSSAAPRRIR